MENNISVQERITDAEFKIIAHSLGVRDEHFRDSKLAENFPFRNHFCASVNHSDFPTLDGLQLKGLMRSWNQFNNLYFGVTDKGIEVFRNKFKRFCLDYNKTTKENGGN